MKITWFAAMTFRIQIAGRIIVIDPEGAPEGIDPAELASGAQGVVAASDDSVPLFDPQSWRPRRRVRLIDEEEGDEALNLYRLGEKGLVADSADEGVLVIEDGDIRTQWGRWADNGVVVLCGTGAECAAQGAALLEIAWPRLIALAVTDGAADMAFEALAPQLEGASLTVLEPGLAVEA